MIPILVTIILLSIAAFLAYRAEKLTGFAACCGAFTAFMVVKGTGITGLVMMAAFFILGVGATSWQFRHKQAKGLAEVNNGRRHSGQVLANSAFPALLGLYSWIIPQHSLFCPLMVAACFSSATADTLSSELGNLYGKKFYNILSFKKDKRGDNGVVSLEGTLSGIIGSLLIAIVYITGTGWSTNAFLIIVVSGTAGNLFDSVIGATAERRGLVGNDLVNFLNTVFAALVALLLMVFL